MIVIVIAIIVLLAWPKSKEDGGNVSTSVPCINGNVPLVQHVHPRLTIIADGKEEAIPANIGLSGACERILHTHDEDAGQGVIHLESQDNRQYTLADFFSVWGKTIERAGYTVMMTVDGQPSTELGALILKDGQQIALSYQRIAE